MKLRPLPGRILLGTIGLLGMTGLVVDAIDGKFSYRGHVTVLAEEPDKFWMLILIFGALFAGLLFWAASGAGFERHRPDPPDGEP